MTLFIQTNASGAGAGTLNPNQAQIDLAVATNGDTGLGINAAVGNLQQVTYGRTLAGAPPIRIDAMVNTNFNPNYGAGPQAVRVIILPVGSDFMLLDGTSILIVGGTALPPNNTSLAGATLNGTNDCLIIYDTTQNNGAGYCMARNGTGGTLDLQTPNPIILYHELSHAFRIVNNGLLALSGICNPSSPEENAAIMDENDLRTQVANAGGVAAVLRDPGIHCGGVCGGGRVPPCCIVASVTSGSPISPQVQMLRSFRDLVLRSSEVGHSFFARFFQDYYAFSPQICTLMAKNQYLRSKVYDCFVSPLLVILGLMRDRILHQQDAAALGRAVQAALQDQDDRLSNNLQESARLWQGEIPESDQLDVEVIDAMQSLLATHARKSDHIDWALIAPLRMLADAVQSHRDGQAFDEVGQKLESALNDWSTKMPVDHIWASLSQAELEIELAELERLAMRSPDACRQFRKRLKQQFPEITSIAKLAA